MQSLCKFKTSTSLTQQELDFVLTPDECVRMFSRVRHINDALSALPPALAAKIPASGRKDIFSLQTSLRTQLVKAEWVGLAITKRSTPLTSTQIQPFPAFQAVIERLQNQAPPKVKKAGYKAVTDDVSLARNIPHTPVEPSPENKIVVEFAGQWSPNAACLALGRSESDKEKVTNAKPDEANGHRSLATFKDLEPEPRSLYIKIPCLGQPIPIMLKLADDIEPVSKDTQKDEWDNVLVPVLPTAFIDEEFEAKAAFQSGYIYIVWNGKVWRELAVLPNSYYSDVDLDYYRYGEEKTPVLVKRDKYLDLYLSDQDSHFPMPDHRFIVKCEDGSTRTGKLDINACAHVSGLVGETVQVEFPDYQIDGTSVVVEYPLQEGEEITQALAPREHQGHALSMIWVPYKILGEQQTDLHLVFSEGQLSIDELTQLEAEDEELAVSRVSLDTLSLYSESQAFTGEDDTLYEVGEFSLSANYSQSCLTDRATALNALEGMGVANVVTPPPCVQLSLVYEFDTAYDREDDYILVADSQGDWRVKQALGKKASNTESNARTLRFGVAPKEVEKVDISLVRINKESTPYLIRGQVAIEELQSQPAGEPE